MEKTKTEYPGYLEYTICPRLDNDIARYSVYYKDEYYAQKYMRTHINAYHG